MIKVCDNLYVGNQTHCFYDEKIGWVVIHACKDPCHKIAVHYRGSLPKTHPNYLIKKDETHLYLNMVDMETKLTHIFTGPIVSAALDFIDKNIQMKSVLIHCNHGQSRSPSLALLYLAKRKKIISNEKYESAKMEFIKLFPTYSPGRGIELYLTDHWKDIS